jgi:hypothetical protein
MRFVIVVLLILLAGTAVGMLSFVPWWGFTVSSFIVAVLIRQTPSLSFAAGFLGMFLSWGGLSWWIDLQNGHILSVQIAEIFPLQGSSAAMIFITGIIGGLLAGLSALAGSYLRAEAKK